MWRVGEVSLHCCATDWASHQEGIPSVEILPMSFSPHVGFAVVARYCSPEGPSTLHVRTLVPKAITGMVLGTKVLKYWVLGPSTG